MRWIVFLPLTLFAVAVSANFVVTLLVERAEMRRKLRNPVRARNVFRPVLIQGGKAQAPPVAEREISRPMGRGVSRGGGR